MDLEANQCGQTLVAESGPVISIVIPCLNEAAAIGRVVDRAAAGLQRLGGSGEVIVVDNGSTDGTAALARRAGAYVVDEPRQGYGAALQRGFAEARGRYIVMADGDETYPIDGIAPFIKLLESGCDVVYGDRFAGGIEPAAMSWSHRYIGTPVLSWLVRRLSGTNVSDSQCGMRAFRAEALRAMDLRTPGMDLNMEMLVKAGLLGLTIGQVPIKLARRVGESKLETIPDGWRNLRYLLLVSPNHLFMVPGALLLVLGALLLLTQVLLPSGVPFGATTWRATYAPVVLGSVGAQIIWFGLLAKLYYAGSGVLPMQPPRASHAEWLGNRVSLERLLLLSLAILFVGCGLEVLLGLQQLQFVAPRDALASVGAFAVLVGVQSFFASFVAYLLSSGHARQPASTTPLVRAEAAVQERPSPTVPALETVY